MFHFTSMELIDRPFFKKQSFDFSTPGVKLILGKNLNASASNTNGAGKSMFFSQLPELLLNEVLHGTSRDQIRTGSVKVHGKDDHHLYTIERSFSPTEKISITRDGKPLEIHKLGDARARLAKIIPYTEQEIFTFLFLDSQLPHPLIAGDTSVRKTFFTSFFHLGSLRNARKVISAELSELRSSKLLYADLMERRKELKAAQDQDLESKEAELVELVAKVDRLEATLRDWISANSIATRMNQYKDCLELMSSLNLSDEDEVATHVKKRKSERKEASAQLRQWDTYKEWQSRGHAERKEAIRCIKEDFRANIVMGPEQAYEALAALKAKLVFTKKKLAEAEDAVSDSKRDRRRLDVAKADNEENLHKATKALRELTVAKDVCPTCGSAFDNKHAKKELASYGLKVQRLTREGAYLKSAYEDLQDVDEWGAHAHKLEVKIDSMRASIQTLSSAIDILRTPAPNKPTMTIEKATEEEEACSRELAILEKATDALEVKAEWNALPRALRKADPGSFDKKQTEFMKAAGVRSAVEIEVAKARESREELKKVIAKLRPLREKLADQPALELLEGAFSTKGVEKEMISSLCGHLQTTVNKYAKLIFPEDYRFEFELETQFSILVHRKYGKKNYVSDVRKLSGAEKKLFSLVLLVSLLTFVPKSRRTSLLILDEPTAAMGPENVASFIRFLPILQKVIPTIVVITPLDPSHYASIQPDVFTVVKQRDGTSTIVKGQA